MPLVYKERWKQSIAVQILFISLLFQRNDENNFIFPYKATKTKKKIPKFTLSS
jgi:hypothetical protein